MHMHWLGQSSGGAKAIAYYNGQVLRLNLFNDKKIFFKAIKNTPGQGEQS